MNDINKTKDMPTNEGASKDKNTSDIEKTEDTSTKEGNPVKVSNRHLDFSNSIIHEAQSSKEETNTNLSTSVNLHKEPMNLHRVPHSYIPLGDPNKNYNPEFEIGALKFKLESFAENVDSKFQALTKEVADIKENKVYSIIILENTVHELKKEKYDLIKANNDLREKNEVLHQKISDFNSTVQRLEDEKQSLITTLKLVQKETQTVQPDLNDRMQNLENENKSLSTALTLLQHELDNTQQHKWKVVKTKYNKPPPETPAGSNTIETKNQYTTLRVTDSEHDDIAARLKTQQILDETSNTTKHSNIQMVGKSSGPSNSNESSRDSQRSQPRIAILGDSMIKHLDTKRMQNGLKKGKVTIKTFPGAGINQMKHYAVPTLITKPKTLIFHVGTNDLHNKTPEDLINAMNDLGETIHRQNNDLELIWSEIITRTDDPNLAEKVNVVNAELAKLCTDKGWGLIKHNNIKGSLLNNSGLHLNKHAWNYYIS
ncbi:Scavenger receptor cysteine-rich type 1 M130 [Paramuricea clavata]|uniref:Scavenger receptor cysteine-rich type 1 M130 n=1 Tax=Paramuricea clavata TaxID=317549 RepID=A0A6S7HWM0_PARCT|nr:Scavenger receptor cysteine-rich type 1 M130 [Paramuricea clavata]